MGIVEGKTMRRGGKQMPKDKRRGKKWRRQDRYIGRYWQHPGVLLYGLGYCRLAAGLTERELAELVDTSQTTINNLERASWEQPGGPKAWVKADYRMILRLRRALRVRPVDLMLPDVIEDKRPESERADSALRRERDERRHQVNRIKRGRMILMTSKSVRLGGLKKHRERAGLDQEELARLVGTNQTTIHQLEKRYTSRGAYMKTVKKLCRVLKVQPADLIGWDPVE
jgi:DNA-binding XRE family transcriptional regulator